MVDQTALTANEALHAAIVAALDGAGIDVVVNPARGRALPYAEIQTDTVSDSPLGSDADAREAQHTKTIRAYAASDSAARALGSTIKTAALGITLSGFDLLSARLDIDTTGPDNDPSPTTGTPLGSRVIRLRYTIAP